MASGKAKSKANRAASKKKQAAAKTTSTKSSSSSKITTPSKSTTAPAKSTFNANMLSSKQKRELEQTGSFTSSTGEKRDGSGNSLTQKAPTVPTTSVAPTLTPEQIAEQVANEMGGNEPVSQGNATTQEGPLPAEEEQQQEQTAPMQQNQSQGTVDSQGGSTQANVPPPQGNLQTGSIVDYLTSTGQDSSFNARKRLAESMGINGYTGSAQQNTSLLSSLRGAPVTPQEQVTPTSAGAVMQNETQSSAPALATNEITLESLKAKLGFTSSLPEFQQDPISSIQSITKQIFSSMGLGDANKEITKISKELEKMENKRDAEIRAINDDPWLTEGVRLRQVEKAKEKASDEINNRVNKLQLLESVRDDAQQQAQFALGTAISIYDSQRRFQADQIQQYYTRAQQDFENSLKLYEMSQPTTPDMTNEMQEYVFSVEQGFGGSFLDYKQAVATAGRAPLRSSSGGGSGGGLSGGGAIVPGALTDASGKPIKLTATQVEALSGYDNTVDAANRAKALIDQGVSTGPLAGRLLQGAKLFGKGDTSQLELEQTLGKLRADFMKAISGAAVSDAEVIRLSKFLPDITDQEATITSKLNTLVNETISSKENYLRTLGVVSQGGGSYEDYLRVVNQ